MITMKEKMTGKPETLRIIVFPRIFVALKNKL